ncbi:MAG: hypothetical protein Q9227_009309 [Pyrenula ochraceoflavens]
MAFGLFKKHAMEFLGAIPEHSLESFSWKLFSCVPKAILEEFSAEYYGFSCLFPYRQNEVSYKYDDYFYYRLLRLASPQKAIQLTALRRLFLQNAPVLGTELDMDEELKTFRALNIPGLDSLTLIKCDGTLSLLRLLREAGESSTIALSHLEAVARYGSGDAPTDYLEEQKFRESWLSIVHSDIDRILRSCERLQALYFLFYNNQEMPSRFSDCTPQSGDGARQSEGPSRRFLDHSDARQLKRLIYHEIQSSESNSDTCLSTELWKSIVRMRLECLGICDLPARIIFNLRNCGSSSTLKVLHVRRTKQLESRLPRYGFDEPNTRQNEYIPKDEMLANWKCSRDFDRIDESSNYPYNSLLNLVEWCFGPKGLPTLELLAYGDFQHSGRYRDETLLFRRTPSPNTRYEADGIGLRTTISPSISSFQEIAGHHPEWARVHAPWKDFLGACPTSSSAEKMPPELSRTLISQRACVDDDEDTHRQ